MSAQDSTFVAAADQLGARLCRDAIWWDGQCNWVGPSMEMVSNQWQVIHKSYGPDLYAGTSGIALFLCYLYNATGEKQYKRAAQGALNHAVNHLDDLPPGSRSGVYCGLLGIAHSCHLCAQQLNSDYWQQQSVAIGNRLVVDGVATDELDIVTGSAGAIPALIQLCSTLEQDSLMQLAIRHGDQLIDQARREERGCCWAMMPSMPALTGFAHGAAGAAWALLELANATGENRFQQMAAEGIRWEQSFFNSEQNNWPDLRQPMSAGSEPVYGFGWCHGSPGIGISRLRAFELTGHVEYRQQAEAAVAGVSRFLSQLTPECSMDFTFCHGISGLIELLLYSSELLKQPEQRPLVEKIALNAINRFTNNVAPWPCGVPDGGEAPGLMLGIAGVGYLMLRLCTQNPPPSITMIGANQAVNRAATNAQVVA